MSEIPMFVGPPGEPSDAAPDSSLRFAHHAMACDWELRIFDEPARYAADVARVVFAEVDRLEQELSRFVTSSDVARINAAPVGRPEQVGIEAIECLALARRIFDGSGGAFDPTIGRLIPRRGSSSGQRGGADSTESTAMGASPGMDALAIDGSNRTVARLHPDVCLDLGAIGKGHAIDRCVGLLRDWGVARALLHSGQSTVFALGESDGGPCIIALRNPLDPSENRRTVTLRDAALSGSANLLKFGHIVDPRTGHPASREVATWAVAQSAALSDALSTAALLLSDYELQVLSRSPATRGVGTFRIIVVRVCAIPGAADPRKTGFAYSEFGRISQIGLDSTAGLGAH